MAAKPNKEKKSAYDLDLAQRDPLNLNEHLQIEFEDVLGEAKGAHSIDCIWRNTFRCFECWKSCWYKTLSLLCGLCIGAYWGCSFAELAFTHVFCYTPGLRSFGMRLRIIRECNMLINEATWGTCCTVAGNLFSRIRVQQD